MRNKILQLIILILLSLSLKSKSVKISNYLNRGSSLLVENHNSTFITSPNYSFTCGFYSVRGNVNAYWFAIWFTNSKDKTIVWIANRDRPVNGRGSKVQITGNGAMVLYDTDGSVVWETNTSAVSSTVRRAALLDSGNLVTMDTNGSYIWQSFHHPTDTLLPNQILTRETRLVSSLKQGSFESGYFILSFSTDNVLRLIYDGPEISSSYWPRPDVGVFANGRTNYNNTRIAILHDSGQFESSDMFRFNASDAGFGVKRRLTMDYDGNLRLYSLNDLTKLWSVSWQAMLQLCHVHGLCGRNGICVYTPKPKCSCPPGYERVDLTDWGKGCKPLFNRSCSPNMIENVKFVELNNTDYFGFDLVYSGRFNTMESCRKICLEDCRCEAFSYRLTGEGFCYAKIMLFNGFQTPSFSASFFLKVANDTNITKNGSNLQGSDVECGLTDVVTVVGSPSIYVRIRKSTTRWVYLYAFASAIGAFQIIIFVVGWWFLFKKHGRHDIIEEGYKIISSQFRTFTYNELKIATNGFKVEVGQGGFGTVYKGTLVNERVVAIKKLEGSFQGEEEFWAEVNTIGKLNHMNVVRMWGFCFEKKYRLLVYEYVQNLSLDKHLFHANFLEWKVRFHVALGTARGLAYLHHECLEWVIHCDIKPENILLDEKYEPKIADFGLAKLSQRGLLVSGLELSRIRGTKGYMAPEWTMNLPITAKVDVYSYGVVILEMVKGVRLSNWVTEDNEGQESELVRFVKTVKQNLLCENENWIDKIVDSRLDRNFNKKQAEELVKIGILCVDEDRNKRPKIETVINVLQDCEE